MNMQALIRMAALSIEDITRADPPEGDHQWPMGSTHWHVTLSCQGRRWGVPYHMGPVHTEPPSLSALLDDVASDCRDYENAEHDYQEWCTEAGLSGPYVWDEKTETYEWAYASVFRAVEQQAMDLRELIGEQCYNLLVHQVDGD